jgi:hypothetical protein
MREVERLTDEVIKDVKDKGGIDYLILSAGGPPTGVWKKSPEVATFVRTGSDVREWRRRLPCSAYHGTSALLHEANWSSFYTTYRLLPYIKESVVVIGSPGWGKFYDEEDPGFEKPENRQKMTILNQGRRDSLYLDAIFKVPGYSCIRH